MRPGRRRRPWRLLGSWASGAALQGPTLALAKWVEGRVTLAPGQAKVFTKFCFDFNSACQQFPPGQCEEGKHPGELFFNVSSGRRLDGDVKQSRARGARSGLSVALLDDEYFSFPEVSQVWDELNCSEVKKAAKQNLEITWAAFKRPSGQILRSTLIEKIRPRWWYIAFVSCDTSEVEFSYQAHVVNILQGSRRELSFDEPGVWTVAFLFAAFVAVVVMQCQSACRWREEGAGPQDVLPLLTASATLAAVGFFCWLAYYWGYSRTGRSNSWWLLFGRGGVVMAKALMSILLLIMARGDCVSTPGISWPRNWDITVGLSVFAALSLLLELYGDSEMRTTNTEYIYDTRPGTALVAFDVFWLWRYVSRSWRSFQMETRVKQRRFYKHYAPTFALWFAMLPVVAAIAQLIAPWYRLYVVFVVSGLVHAMLLGLLVRTFSPSVAPTLYDVSGCASGRCETAKYNDELTSMLEDTDI